MHGVVSRDNQRLIHEHMVELDHNETEREREEQAKKMPKLFYVTHNQTGAPSSKGRKAKKHIKTTQKQDEEQ
jgi:hypothetical protein